MSFGIVIKNYEHINRSFKNWDTPKGKYISSKRAYNEAMAREGMVPYEKAQQMVKDCNEKRDKQSYDGLSEKAANLIRSVHKGKNGKINLSDRQVNKLKEVGVKIELPDWCPKHYSKSGGFADGK